MTDTLERVFVLIVIIIGVLFIGVGLNVFESFTTMRSIIDPTTGEQTGLVTDSPGNPSVSYKSTNSNVNDQYKNVSTREQIYQSVTQRYSNQIPWRSYTNKDMTIDKILKPSGGTLPDVVLNPSSNQNKQVVCKLNDNCEDYVYGWEMYCPIGIDRMETGVRESGKRRYNGCYSAGRTIPMLACRHDIEEANSMAGGNLCSVLSRLRIQRVGTGFMMIPRYSVLSTFLDKTEGSDREKIIEVIHLRHNIVLRMVLSLKSMVSQANKDKIVLNQLNDYFSRLFYDTIIIYQPITDGMKYPRAGFYARDVSVPSVQRLPVEPDFNITGKSLGDTTKGPLPELTIVY